MLNSDIVWMIDSRQKCSSDSLWLVNGKLCGYATVALGIGSLHYFIKTAYY
jgi:hypothetical protein